MMVKGLAGCLLLAPLIASVAGKSTPVYKDASASVDKRVKDLLGRMTIEDKMAQLMQGNLLELSPTPCNQLLGSAKVYPLQAISPTG
jgi:hypothetical protein